MPLVVKGAQVGKGGRVDAGESAMDAALREAREEIDLIEKGANYGWAYREGFIAGPKSTTNSPSIYRNPIAEYAHGGGLTNGGVVTGGRVYRGNAFPELVGQYIC